MAWLSGPFRGALAAALLLTFTAPALASPKVAALVPQIKPNASPELQSRFHEAVTRGLSGPDADVIAAPEVRLRLGVSDEMLNCAGPGICAARAATALHADHVVATDINQLGKDYTIKLVMMDAAGREIARAEEPCDICTMKDAEDAATRAAARLMLTARTNPAQTPAAAAPPPPPPPARTEAPPPAPPPPPPSTPPAATQPPPPAAAAAPTEKKMFPWRWLAVGSLVLGVVGVAVGAPLVAIDGNPTCDLPDPKHSCPNVYNTGGGGAALLTLGVAGLAASGVLFYVDYRVRHRAPATVSFAPIYQGGMLTYSMQF